ncbi:MAG: universal stress protein [Chloroflexi bacterium]|nr:universal stress protein [Chloroflexota bacterium]
MRLDKILVPVNGSSTDDEALQVATAAGRRNKARIYVIYVIEVKRTLPLDAEIEPEIERGERVLDHAEQVAQASEGTIETELMQAREVGPAIVDEAVERAIDVVIMGVPYKKRYGEFTLGATANYVLKNAPCSVWVCREPISATTGP